MTEKVNSSVSLLIWITILVFQVTSFSMPEATRGRSYYSVIQSGTYPKSEGILQRTRRQTVKDPNLVYITFINKSGRQATVFQVDYFGFTWPKFDLRPNEPITYFQSPGSSWVVQDSQTGSNFLLNGKPLFHVDWKMRGEKVDVRIKAPDGFKELYPGLSGSLTVQGTPYYLEIMVIADSTMVKHYGRNHVEEYILTIFGIVAKVFKDKSIGTPINIAVTDIYLSEKDPPYYTLKENKAEVSARSACRFVRNLKSKKSIARFDIGIVLTRKYIGPSGYAAMYTMCTSRSCALARENGFSSAYVIAHEIGHSLGLEHDGEGEECVGDKTQGSIMAPKVYSKHDKFHWSKCSKKALSENVRYFGCLENKPSKMHSDFMKVNKLLPGVRFSLDKQCQIYHGVNARSCAMYAYRICNYLWCKRRPWSDCSPMFWTAPVDGSECSRDKWCVKGRCVHRQEPVPVNGNWGQWSTFGSCRGTCNLGIQTRIRLCNNPRPNHGGNDCQGESKDMKTCVLEPCRGMKQIQEARNRVCKERGDGWIVITPGMIEAITADLGVKCSFENGSCGWRNEEGASMSWTRHRGATPSGGTGPNADHTLKTAKGYYMYVEASWVVTYHPYRKGDKAHLRSNEIIFLDACLSFYYHILGDKDCELIVYLQTNKGDEEIWKKVGDQGKEWKRAVLHIYNKEPYRIKFVTVRGSSYKSDIAIDDVDFRQGRCSDAQTSCQVACYSEALKKIAFVNSPDGLQCHGNASFDLCYESKCVKIGCDKMLNSTKDFDQCGVCGGNGQTCSLYSGSKNVEVSEVFESVLQIPQGTSDIVIWRMSNPESFIGIKASNSTIAAGFNHDESRWPPGHYSILGTEFSYDRNKSTEKIRSLGPLERPINVFLFSPKLKGYTPKSSRSPGERVAFQMRLSSQAQNSYSWVHMGWKTCHGSCEGGSQDAVLACFDGKGKNVLDIFCEHLDKPTHSRACLPADCRNRFVWVALNWTQCSATCGQGYQARRVMCRQQGRSFVNRKFCDIQSPPRVRKCYAGPCPSFALMPGQWEPCSKTCNGGMQRRKIYCVNTKDSEMTSSYLLCSGEYPVSIRPCNLASCNTKKMIRT